MLLFFYIILKKQILKKEGKNLVIKKDINIGNELG